MTDCIIQPTGLGPGGQGSGAGGVYPRRLSITRFAAIASGNVGYRAPTRSLEGAVLTLTGIPAEIAPHMRGPNPLPGVPNDAVGRTMWWVFIPVSAAALGSIKRDDIATDDLGRRFKLNEPFWGAIDVQVEAELLRA